VADDPLQLDLFDGDRPDAVRPAAIDADHIELTRSLPTSIRLGTSSWSFPGWTGLVWARRHGAVRLARDGLPAYAAHPLLRVVGIDRTFYGPMTATELGRYRDAVPDDFQFVVKAHEACTVAMGARHHRGLIPAGAANPHFLEPRYATDEVVGPYVDGLSDRAGVLVFQVPPQPIAELGSPERFCDRLEEFLRALPVGPNYAVELRNPTLLTAAYGAMLRRNAASHCLNAHPAMPSIEEQLRRVGDDPGPITLVRWLLHRGQRYDTAVRRYEPFDRLRDRDPATRAAIAQACATAAAAGKPVYVTVNNKAEGSAPLSVVQLARAIVDELA